MEQLVEDLDFSGLVPASDDYVQKKKEETNAGELDFSGLEPLKYGPIESTGKVLGSVLGALTKHAPAGFAAAIEGSDILGENDWKDYLIERSKIKQREAMEEPIIELSKPYSYLLPTTRSLAELEYSFGKSFPTQAAGLFGGVGGGFAGGIGGAALGSGAGPIGSITGALTGAKIGSSLGSAALSGPVAFRVAVNDFLRNVKEAYEEETLEKTGKLPSKEDLANKLKEFEDAAVEYGLYEAVPEAASQALFSALFMPFSPGKAIVKEGAKGLSKKLIDIFGKNTLARAAGKITGDIAGELATETITQMGQHNVEARSGLIKEPERSFLSPSDWAASLGEVARPTIAQSLLTMGIGAVPYGKAGRSISKFLGSTAEPRFSDVKTDTAGPAVEEGSVVLSGLPRPDVAGTIAPPKEAEGFVSTPEGIRRMTEAEAYRLEPTDVFKVTPEGIASPMTRGELGAADVLRAEREGLGVGNRYVFPKKKTLLDEYITDSIRRTVGKKISEELGSMITPEQTTPVAIGRRKQAPKIKQATEEKQAIPQPPIEPRKAEPIKTEENEEEKVVNQLLKKKVNFGIFAGLPYQRVIDEAISGKNTAFIAPVYTKPTDLASEPELSHYELTLKDPSTKKVKTIPLSMALNDYVKSKLESSIPETVAGRYFDESKVDVKNLNRIIEDAVARKDTNILQDIVGNTDNITARKIFEGKTGIKLPGTTSGTISALRNWSFAEEPAVEQAQIKEEKTEIKPTPVKKEEAAQTLPIEAAEPATVPPVEAKPTIKQEGIDTVVTPSGKDIDVAYEVKEADDLLTSLNDDMRMNVKYPQELQPRDRTRYASQNWVENTARNLDPRRLTKNVLATEGAPIIGDDNVVESGNGRVLAIRKAYQNYPDKAEQYRKEIESLGFDTRGFKKPVLVRKRITPMSREERIGFTIDANKPTVATMSATEQAFADSKKISEGALNTYTGGDVLNLDNRKFLRSIINDIFDKEELGSVFTREGDLSIDAEKRIKSALLARAFDDESVIRLISEEGSDGLKSLGNALFDVSAQVAQLKNEIEKGNVSRGVDITDNINEAVKLIMKSRRNNKPLSYYVDTNDLFAGGVSPETKAILKLIHSDEGLSRIRGYNDLNEIFKTYFSEASKVVPEENMFGQEPVSSREILDRIARVRAEDARKRQRFAKEEGVAEGVGEILPERQEPATLHEPIQELGEQRTTKERQGSFLANREAGRRTNTERGYDFKIIDDDVVSVINKNLSANEKRIINAIEKEIDRLIGRDKVVSHISHTLKVITEPDVRVSGLYFPAEPKDIIAVAIGDLYKHDKPLNTALGRVRHEVMHYLTKRGFFSDKELDVLAKTAAAEDWYGKYNIDKRYEGFPDNIKFYEAIAEAFRDYMGKRTKAVRQMAIRRAFNRLKDFYTKVVKIAKDAIGIPDITAEDIFEAIARGEYRGRTPKYEEIDIGYAYSAKDADNEKNSWRIEKEQKESQKKKGVARFKAISKDGNVVVSKVMPDNTPENVARDNLYNVLQERRNNPPAEEVKFDINKYEIHPDIADISNDRLWDLIKSNPEMYGVENKREFYEKADRVRLAVSEHLFEEEARKQDELEYREKKEKLNSIQDDIEKFLDSNGIKYKTHYSETSDSRYIVADIPTKIDENGEEIESQEIKVRISDHEIPPTYGNTYGYADFEFGVRDSYDPYFDGDDTSVFKDKVRDMLAATRKAKGTGRLYSIEDSINKFSVDVPPDTKFDSVVYNLVNEYVDLDRIQKRIKDNIQEIPDYADPLLKITLFHGRVESKVNDFENKEMRPIIKKMSKHNIDIEELNRFLHAKHAPEANMLIAERNPSLPDGGSGMTTKEAIDYINSIPRKKRKVLEDINKDIRKIIQKTRDIMVDGHLISKRQADVWANMFDNYVPLMREDEISGYGRGFSIRGKEAKHRIGSRREVSNILANIIEQRQRAIVRSEKNRVAQSVMALFSLADTSSFALIEDVPVVEEFNPETGMVEQRADNLYKNRDNVLSLKVADEEGNIHEKSIVFNDRDERIKRLLTSLKRLDETQLDIVTKSVGTATRMLARLATQYNVAFGPVNLVRDTGTAVLNASSTPIKHRAHEFLDLGKTARYIKEIMIIESGGKGDEEVARYWKELKDAGGLVGFIQYFKDTNERALKLDRMLKEEKKYSPRWILKNVGDIITSYNQAFEGVTRLRAYIIAREEGLSKERAAEIAKKITVDFNRKGAWGSFINSYFMFFNASMQGAARIAETMFKIDDGRLNTIRLTKNGVKIIAGGIALGAVQQIMLSAFGYGDDDPPEHVRERNFIIPIPMSSGKYITIPLPLGYNTIFNFGRLSAEFMTGRKSMADSIIKFMSIFADAFNPLGETSPSIQLFLPTVLDPLGALAENKDWTGRPIYREDINKLMPTPGFKRTFNSTSNLYKWTAEVLNNISGGDEIRPGIISPTPEHIQYIAEFVGSGVARELGKAWQTTESLITGDELPPYRIPIIGRFYGKTGTSANVSINFYSKLKEANLDYKTLKEGSEKSRDRLLADKGRIRSMMIIKDAYDRIEKLKDIIKDKEEAIRRTDEDRYISEERRKSILDGLKSDIKELKEKEKEIMYHAILMAEESERSKK